jgi:hypothetical protein
MQLNGRWARFVQAAFRTNVNAGILVLPSSASTGIDADLEGAIAVGNGTGISAANGVRMQIERSDTAAPALMRRARVPR